VRNEFLSIASHELKTPLSALMLQMESLIRIGKRAPAPGAERMTEKLDRAAKQVQRLARLVNELLDVTRIASGQFELKPQTADLATLARDAAARSEEDLRHAGCALELVVESAMGSWDSLRIDQVITNLLSNAMKYGTGKPIRLVVSKDGPVAQ